MSVETAFAEALAALWLRDGIVVHNPQALAADVAAAFACGGDRVDEAAAMLDRSGVRAQWNGVLRDRRARALASRIEPHITGRMIDVLSGDGSICRALEALGVTGLAATERQDDYRAYPSQLPDSVRFVPFSETLDLDTLGADTALVSTVLHHERDSIGLLDMLAQTRIRRWLVVENCVTPRFTHAFHTFADVFFNTCLNDIDVHCGDEHRTLDEWVVLLGGYGRVTVAADYFDVPGIPFPYTMLIVDRSA